MRFNGKTDQFRRSAFKSQYFLDQITSPSTIAAFSHRRLKSTATSAIRVREDNSNNELDIGFVGEDLDATAITDFLTLYSASNAYETTMYDQVGSKNVLQATSSSQPLALPAGLNGHYVGDYDGTDAMSSAVFGSVAQPGTVVFVFKVDTASGTQLMFDGNGATTRWAAAFDNTKWSAFSGVNIANTNLVNNSYHVHYIEFNGTSGNHWIDNGNLLAGNIGTYPLTKIVLGSFYNGAAKLNGKIAEAIWFNKIFSSDDRAFIHSNVNSYWNIY